jgi:1-acyl-sn-glycerol-3-phosphate acyltransferase
MFYWVVKAVLAPILRLLFRPWAEGAECVPKTGPAILASNHLSFSDHFFAPLPLPRKVVFLAKSEYFTGRGIKGLFSRAFFSGVGQIPVDRSGGKASERALATGLRVLAGGQLLGIYPEGTRTPDGRLFRGKTGVARLALEARVPVVPCAMIGGFEFQPPGKLTPQFRVRPGVKFGKPLDFSRYYGMENDKLVLRAITDEIIYEIMKLSGQEYVDEYAAQHKAKRHAEKRALKHDAAAKEPPTTDSAAADSAAADSGSPAAGTLAAGTPAAASSAAGSPVAGAAVPLAHGLPVDGTAPGTDAGPVDAGPVDAAPADAAAADRSQAADGVPAKAMERAPAAEGAPAAAADSSASGG